MEAQREEKQLATEREEGHSDTFGEPKNLTVLHIALSHSKKRKKKKLPRHRATAVLDMLRFVLSLVPALCPPSLGTVAREWAQYRRRLVEEQALKSLPVQVRRMTRELDAQRVIAHLWQWQNGRELPQPRGDPVAPERDILALEGVFTEEVLALLFWCRADCHWYWLQTTVPTTWGYMVLTTYEIQVRLPSQRWVTFPDGVEEPFSMHVFPSRTRRAGNRFLTF